MHQDGYDGGTRPWLIRALPEERDARVRGNDRLLEEFATTQTSSYVAGRRRMNERPHDDIYREPRSFTPVLVPPHPIAEDAKVTRGGLLVAVRVFVDLLVGVPPGMAGVGTLDHREVWLRLHRDATRLS
jgi:hypothetical protein